MIQKNLVLILLILAVIIIITSTFFYPGGSQNDVNSIGFNWQHNYFCNLFNDTAMNGDINSAKPWAIIGMFFLSLSFALFFYQTSKKLNQKLASQIVKYCGVGSMLLSFLVVTPLHDIALNISNTLALLSLFYIIVFVFRSKKLVLLKILSVLLMLVSYATMFVYYSGYHITYLPIMQKVSFILLAVWILLVTYTYNGDNEISLK